MPRYCWIRLGPSYAALLLDSARYRFESAWVSLEWLDTASLAFLRAWKECRGRCVFKFHMLVHLAKQIAEQGDPTWYWTCPDEADNRNMQR
eukprot:8845913-Pyramimonas_sp.AAC.1